MPYVCYGDPRRFGRVIWFRRFVGCELLSYLTPLFLLNPFNSLASFFVSEGFKGIMVGRKKTKEDTFPTLVLRLIRYFCCKEILSLPTRKRSHLIDKALKYMSFSVGNKFKIGGYIQWVFL